MDTIIVEGIGDIVGKPTGYGRALRKLIIDREEVGPKLRVIFVDVCEEWHKSGDPDLIRDRKATMKRLTKWGAEFIDKSPSNKAGLRDYHRLLNGNVDAVFVATPDRRHIQVARHWLSGNCKRIFVEKPLTNDVAEARAWMRELRNNKRDRSRLNQLDHYRFKIHPQLKYAEHVNQMLDEIARLKFVRFYLLEDHSGADHQYLTQVLRKKRRDRNGPIENEGRIDTLQAGISLDLLPHLLALLSYFGKPQTFKVAAKGIRAARYVGVDYDYQKSASIKGETFAALEFSFVNNSGRRTWGEAYIGKGIHGSTEHPALKNDVKLLELEGEWGKKIEFDFTNSVVSAVTKNSGKSTIKPIVDLEPDPYYYLLRNIALKRRGLGADLGIPIKTGALILQKIMSEVTRHTNIADLPVYKLGNGKGRLPPKLEDLLAGGNQEIEPLHKFQRSP
jgi:predicted dehydrogenase